MALLLAMEFDTDVHKVPDFNYLRLYRPFDMYWHYLKRAHTDSIRKVRFVLTTDASQGAEFDDVLIVPLSLDYQHLNTLSSVPDFTRAVVASIHAAFLELCRARKWETKPFENALHSMEQNTYAFSIPWLPKSRNSDRSITIQPWVEYGDELCVYAEMKFKKAIPERVLLTKLKGLVQVDCVVHKCEWESTTVARIYCEYDRDYWRIDTQKREACFVNPKAEAGDPHALYYVGIKYLNGAFLIPDRVKAKFYLEKAAEAGYPRAAAALKKYFP